MLQFSVQNVNVNLKGTVSMAMDLVGYLRVSTKKQGDSGLGLEAQQKAIADYAARYDGVVIQSFPEVESGKKTKRKELKKALEYARSRGATLVVAKLDRLSRNAAFLSTLLDGNVDLIFCDFPSIPTGPVGRFILMTMANVAELEAGLISQRTKASLEAAKARGTLLGSSRPGHWDGRESVRNEALATATRVSAENRRAKLPLIYASAILEAKVMRRDGLSLRQIAVKLSENGIKAEKKKPWNHSQVDRILKLA